MRVSMNRLSIHGLIALLALAVVVGGAPLAAAEDTNSSTNATDLADLSVGERISSIMSAQDAEVTAEFEQHTFGRAIANADSDEERAEIIAQRQAELNSSIEQDLSEKKELREAYKSGNISRAEYVSELSAQSVKAQNINESVESMKNATDGLPTEILKENGINTSALNTLRNEAAEMTGPEVAAVAQTIAGNAPADVPGQRGNHGKDAPGRSDPNERGAPDDAGGNGNAPTGDEGDYPDKGASGERQPDNGNPDHRSNSSR